MVLETLIAKQNVVENRYFPTIESCVVPIFTIVISLKQFIY